MKTEEEKKVVPSFNELVFENRNKEYGAYQIRKKYNSALFWSILVSIFFISATVITPFVIEKNEPIKPKVLKDSNVVVFSGTVLLPIDEPKIEPEKVEVKAKPLTYVAPEVVDSLSLDDKNSLMSNADLNDLVKNDSIVEYRNEPRIEIAPEVNEKINEPFSVTEKPYFGVGGDSEFKNWIAQNIVYPPSAIEANLQGRVYLQFVVEKDGSISNIQVLKSIDPEFSREAVRVLELSPRWNPGKIDGTPVRVKVSFPITFTLKNI